MDEKKFMITMIEYAKYRIEENQEELLTILRKSYLEFDKTGDFASTYISGQCKEFIDLRVPIPIMENADELVDQLNELADIVYKKNDYYAFMELRIKPATIENENEKYANHDVIFAKIQETIIQGIRDAKYTIWAAIAWFSDKQIYQELLLQKENGVNIRIIISNESSNGSILKNLQDEFDTVIVERRGFRNWNRLHDKFCIIDFQYVMHGSFNWSRTAQENDETLATAVDRDFVDKFADEFLRLYNENK